jgi:hypothetical protein
MRANGTYHHRQSDEHIRATKDYIELQERLIEKLEIPNRVLCALRYFVWAALPFIFFWVAVEKFLKDRVIERWLV